MKILMVSIPSLHFFRWTSQLQDSGHEVYWFDITGMSKPVERISWVSQKTAWKLRWDYPGRIFFKKKFPKIYRWIQKINEKDTAKVYEDYLNEIKPDVVHSFAMQLSCIPILAVMQEYQYIKWIYSSWGSDMYYSKELKIDEFEIKKALRRINYLITDCFRDNKIAIEKGFRNQYLGVFPGNGGVNFKEEFIVPYGERKTILIKAYNDSIGKGINILRAFTDDLLPLLKNYKIVVFGADKEVDDYVINCQLFKGVDVEVYLRSEFIDNVSLLKLMGGSLIYIGNSISDGLPNSLIEAMGMGAFPIQSNPGGVTEELITERENGLLINNPLSTVEIQDLIKEALLSPTLIERAYNYNTKAIKENYERERIKIGIIESYERIFKENDKMVNE